MSRIECRTLLNNPLVSVIIPTYNYAEFLPDAVTSVQQQNYTPLEIIIIDDGSTDGTRQIVALSPIPIRYFYQSNRGPAFARNRGLLAARGEFVAFLDSDDLWPPGKLGQQIAYLLERPHVDVVLGRIERMSLHKMGGFEPAKDNGVIGVHVGGGLFRTSVFDKVGLFDETLRYSEDHDWFLRAREKGVSMAILKQTTLCYRVHDRNMTRAGEAQGFQLTKVLKKSLDRRRLQSNGQVKPLPKLSRFDDSLTG